MRYQYLEVILNKVYVEYDGGIDVAKEQSIYDAIEYQFNRGCDSGCMMFPPFTRDMVFRFESASEAVNAAEKVRSVDGVRVRTELES